MKKALVICTVFCYGFTAFIVAHVLLNKRTHEHERLFHDLQKDMEHSLWKK